MRKIVLGAVLAIAAAGATVYSQRDEIRAWQDRRAMQREFETLVGDPARYEACYAKSFAGDECDPWRLKAQANPEYWPHPNVAPIKWPDAPKERVYKPGMSRIEYFEALCNAEAGEFISKTVKAEGIYMIRPRMEEAEDQIKSRYGIEDPYGHGQGDVWNRNAPAILIGPAEHHKLSTPNFRSVQTPQIRVNIPPTSHEHYDASLFVESKPNEKYREFTQESESTLKSMKSRHMEALTSDFGFTWRGIRRPYDRELGIAGGEVVVVDLRTNEVLGLRRGFILGNRLVGGGMWWLTGTVCPRYSQSDELAKIRRRDKDMDYVMLFLTKVAIPESIKLDK